jgi:4-hydroxy-tetrahydrodipicolinate synthase
MLPLHLRAGGRARQGETFWMARLAGVYPVLPTPFADDGRPDPDALMRLVDFAVNAGVDGIVYPGMASEVETLSPDERAAMVAALGVRLAGRKPFIVGASSGEALAAATRIAEGVPAGAVAAMVMAPSQLGQDVAAHAAFFRAIAAATPGVALMLQNAPAPGGAGLSPHAVAAICAEVPAIRYVKEETLPCGQNVARILAAVGQGIDGVLGGAGARFIMDELARGACGTMPALEIADLHARLWALWQSGDRAAARALHEQTLPLLTQQMVFRWRLTKHVLMRRGLLANSFTRAAGPVPDDGDLAEWDAILERLALPPTS